MGLAGARLAIPAPHLIFKTSLEHFKKIFYCILAFLLTPFHPIILSLKQYIIELKLQSFPRSRLECSLSMVISEQKEEERQKLLNKSIEIQYHLCNHVKLELGLETIFQLCTKLILLAYAGSKTRTTEGLSTMFEEDWKFEFGNLASISEEKFLNLVFFMFLYATTSWSFISNVNSHITGLSAKRKWFPFASKIVVGCYAFFASTSRILTVIMYFTPSLGLFNTLRHWQGEQFNWHPAIINEFVTNKSLYFPDIPERIELNISQIFKTDYTLEGFDDSMKTMIPKNLQNKSFHIHGEIQFGNSTPIPWRYLDRCSYSLLDGKYVTWPKYTLYTYFSLKEYFFIFVGILVTQTIVIFLVKLKLANKNFSKLNILEKIIHSVENSNLAYNVEEWDSPRNGNAVAHIERMKSNQLEGLVFILVNMLFKLMMLCPLYILGK